MNSNCNLIDWSLWEVLTLVTECEITNGFNMCIDALIRNNLDRVAIASASISY